jgi:hypothetical protein
MEATKAVPIVEQYFMHVETEISFTMEMARCFAKDVERYQKLNSNPLKETPKTGKISPRFRKSKGS